MLLRPLLWNYFVHFLFDYAVSTTADIILIFYTIYSLIFYSYKMWFHCINIFKFKKHVDVYKFK